ncbi:unnamed protein product [Merluccius merluccius]
MEVYRRVWDFLDYNPVLKYAAVGTVSIVSVVALRRWLGGGVCSSQVRLQGKTVLITGANTGIGKETARELAQRGARVVMGCRDVSRAEQAALEIRVSTGNQEVVVRQLDLSSLSSVRNFTTEFLATETHLHILVNNAGLCRLLSVIWSAPPPPSLPSSLGVMMCATPSLGVMMCPRMVTEDGFELQLAVNHLGHFLLTNQLLDLLQSSAPSRVITVSSIAHKGGKIHFKDLHFEQTTYDPLLSYQQSKLANILFTRELARRTKGTGVSCFCLHPGVVRTELGRYVETRWPLASTLLSLPAWLLMKSPWQGAQTTLHCCLSPGLEACSGGYFSDCRVKTTSAEARDGLTALRLWDVSARLVDHHGK